MKSKAVASDARFQRRAACGSLARAKKSVSRSFCALPSCIWGRGGGAEACLSPLSRGFESGVAHSGVARFLSSPVVRLSDEGYPSLEGARSVHCMAGVAARRPTSLALSSSSCLGTRWPRANRTVCPKTFRLL